MKTIGLLGGMSWESTRTYYSLINQQINKQLGGLHSAKIILHSVDFAEIERLQSQGDWQTMADLLAHVAQKLANAGADCVLICSNTMHKIADQVSLHLSIPVIHIADATAKRLNNAGVSKVGLLGTKFTMQQTFYRSRLINKHGIDVITPTDGQQDMVHDVIYHQLCRGVIDKIARKNYLEVIHQMEQQGAQGVILGCTEIGLLVQQSDTSVALFDTTEIHAQTAVNFALDDY